MSTALLLPSAILLLLGVLAPLLLLLRMSLYSRGSATGEERYDVLFFEPGTWSLQSYQRIFSEPIYLRVFGSTALLVITVTFLTIPMAYLMGYAIYRASPRAKLVLTLLVVLPKFNNILVFVHGVKMIFGPSGFGPVVAGEVLMLLPYATLAIAASLEAIPIQLTEAARGLGASAMSAFWRITMPLSAPGVSAAAVLTVLWSASAFLAPYLLGQPSQFPVAVEVDRQVHMDLNWPLAAALNLTLLAVLALLYSLFTRLRSRSSV